ncbi:hypothetical protein MTY_1207 [Moorella thermoacetica Y72]|uniref:Uncharacterized protein n=1 Tax=Moorella thermoacetica Y72 TaxID=1325331 RepID=A0A0S6UE34_NEOTH|nr:hypothetical protein MTY_1207 [Moorella thermoacetica Y72]
MVVLNCLPDPVQHLAHSSVVLAPEFLISSLRAFFLLSFGEFFLN